MTRAIEAVPPAAVRSWALRAAEAVGAARAEIDQANVFPVADADTGTNMYLTLAEGARALRPLPGTATSVALLRAFARGALLGARGNSGVILSEFLRGVAGAAGREPASAPGSRSPGHGGGAAALLALALRAGADAASTAVANPVGGTILTAADEAAWAATQAAADDPADVVAGALAARDGARDALLDSPRELAVLARAGVLDAGAWGLVLVLDALYAALHAEPAPGGTSPDAAYVPLPAALSVAPGMITAVDPLVHESDERAVAPGVGADVAVGTTADEVLVDGEFEVMFVLESDGGLPPDLATSLRADLQRVGESVVVVGGAGQAPGSGTWQAHVHTDQPSAAIDLARTTAGDAGTLRQIRVRYLPALTHEHPTGAAHEDHDEPAARSPRPPAEDRGASGAQAPGVVAVTSAPGLVPDLARSGAVVLVVPETRAPDADEVRRAVVDTGAEHVLVLPGTEGARGLTDRTFAPSTGAEPHVEVLDAPTDLHVVAALAAAQLDDGDRRDAMVAALAQVRARRVTQDGAAVLGALDEVLAPTAQVLTVLPGRDVDPAVVDVLAGIARSRVPGVEVVVLSSGRAGALLDLGVE